MGNRFCWHATLDKVFYLNLDRRPDRRQAMEKLFQRLHLPLSKIERVAAVDMPQDPARGCTLSHMEALRRARAKKYRRVWILEDDFQMVGRCFKFHRRLNRVVKNISVDFNVLFTSFTPILVSSKNQYGFCRVWQGLGMSSYMINQAYYPVLHEIFERALAEQQPHDLITQKYQKRDCWYGLDPPIGRQAPGFSDIEQRYCDYEALELGGRMKNILKSNFYSNSER